MTTINEALRAWACGIYPTEAGVELLIRSGPSVYEGAPWITRDGDIAWIDVDELLRESGTWSGGERRMVRIAASLLGGPAVDLSEDVPGLDRELADLVLAAIAHANGSHEHGGIDFNEDGTPRGISRRTTLYPWPESTA